MSDIHNPSPRPLTMTFGFDRNLVWDRGNSVRYLNADISAPPATADAPKPRGLNLAIVIDASGSMAGQPLRAACRAAAGVVEQLTEQDRLSVVSFASDVITHVQCCPMDAAGRAAAGTAIDQLHPRGSTDLSSGWLAGAEHVAADMQRRQGCRNHVVILSDGHANEGIQAPVQLAEIAANLRNRGLFSSTVGIGDGYSTAQLEVIAESGGGRMHHADRPEEIIEVVLAELLDVQATVVEDVVLEVEVPPQANVEVLGTFPLEIRDGFARCAVGSLVGSARRRVVLKIKAPPGEAGRELVFSGRLNWRAPGSDIQQAGRTYPASLRFAKGKENSAQGRDIAASIEVARLWQSLIVRRAVDMSRDGAWAEGAKYLAAQLRFFERYCQGLPGTEELVEELRHMAGQFHRPWEERSRKEMQFAMLCRSVGSADRRSGQRAHWAEYLPGKGAPPPHQPR